MSAREKVLEFHAAMGQPVLTYPQTPPDERVRLRARLIVEECLEFVDACFHDHDESEEALIEAKAAIFR